MFVSKFSVKYMPKQFTTFPFLLPLPSPYFLTDNGSYPRNGVYHRVDVGRPLVQGSQEIPFSRRASDGINVRPASSGSGASRDAFTTGNLGIPNNRQNSTSSSSEPGGLRRQRRSGARLDFDSPVADELSQKSDSIAGRRRENKSEKSSSVESFSTRFSSFYDTTNESVKGSSDGSELAWPLPLSSSTSASSLLSSVSGASKNNPGGFFKTMHEFVCHCYCCKSKRFRRRVRADLAIAKLQAKDVLHLSSARFIEKWGKRPVIKPKIEQNCCDFPRTKCKHPLPSKIPLDQYLDKDELHMTLLRPNQPCHGSNCPCETCKFRANLCKNYEDRVFKFRRQCNCSGCCFWRSGWESEGLNQIVNSAKSKAKRYSDCSYIQKEFKALSLKDALPSL